MGGGFGCGESEAKVPPPILPGRTGEQRIEDLEILQSALETSQRAQRRSEHRGAELERSLQLLSAKMTSAPPERRAPPPPSFPPPLLLGETGDTPCLVSRREQQKEHDALKASLADTVEVLKNALAAGVVGHAGQYAWAPPQV